MVSVGSWRKLVEGDVDGDRVADLKIELTGAGVVRIADLVL